MATQFVLGFGGTGARCVEALVHLMAAGVIKDNVRVMLIDLDETNFNVTQALAQLDRYREIRALRDTGTRGRLFGAELKADTGKHPFFWKYQHTGGRWGDMLGYSREWQGADSTSGLYELLYDPDELDKTDFNKGYIGLAHIGALHMYRILNEAARDDQSAVRRFFNDLRQSATAQDVKLTVFGSLFGGTGASGIPAVPFVLDKLDMFKEVRSKVEVGGVMLAPYFLLPAPPVGQESGPDSLIHPVTAQAAVYHYTSGGTGYNRLYLTGAPQEAKTSEEYVLSGDKQSNGAHFVEVAAAMAAAHFFGTERTDRQEGEGVFYGCDTKSVADWRFPYHSEVDLRTSMLALTTVALVHALHVDPEIESAFRDARWRAGLKLDRNSPGYAEFTAFCYRYLRWAGDLARLPSAYPQGRRANVSLFNAALGAVVADKVPAEDNPEDRAKPASGPGDIGCAVLGNSPLELGEQLNTNIFHGHLGPLAEKGNMLMGNSPLASYLVHLEEPIRKTMPAPTEDEKESTD